MPWEELVKQFKFQHFVDYLPYLKIEILANKVFVAVPSRATAISRASYVFPNDPQYILISISYNASDSCKILKTVNAETKWYYSDHHGKVFGGVFRKLADDWEVHIWRPGHHGHGKGYARIYSPKYTPYKEIPYELYKEVYEVSM